MKLRLLSLSILAAAASTSVWAANDGTLDTTASVGDTTVSITIEDLVQVSVEQDVALTYTPGSDSTGTTGICVYHRDANTAGLTLTSANEDAGDFNMNSGTEDLTYDVDIGGTDFDSSTEQSVAANQASTNCGGGFNHTVTITALAADLDAATSDSYTDTLTIRVEPN